ncbi:MAG TPA: hypothetical protein VJ249_00990 [Candidatus Bathyarchaeia archaeon]|nr:hypothetical protein [Candidatus Bathyarchaeia archaeon]
MRGFIKRALTKTIQIRTAHGDTQQLELAPDKKLLYGMYFAVLALVMLTALETTYMIVFQTFNNEIFAAMMLVVGTILGAFYGQKS